MQKLTKRLIEAAPPGALWDAEVPGFHVRVRGQRRGYFFYYRTKAGQERRPKIGDYGAIDLEAARDIARSWRARVAAGGDPAHELRLQRHDPTVQDLHDRWWSEHAPKKRKSSQRGDRTVWNIILPAWGKRRVREIRRPDVMALHAEVSARAPTLANRMLALVSKAMNLAELWEWRDENTNPTRLVQRNKERRRKRKLNPDEVALVGDVIAGWRIGKSRVRAAFALGVVLLILTGARRSEIFTARWEWIDWHDKVLRIPPEEHKTDGEDKDIALPPVAIAVLLPIRQDDGLILPGKRQERPISGFSKLWRAFLKACQLEKHATLHDLRRTFASAGKSSGINLEMVGALLGHASMQATERYAFLYDDPKREAAERVSGTLKKWLDGD